MEKTEGAINNSDKRPGKSLKRQITLFTRKNKETNACHSGFSWQGGKIKKRALSPGILGFRRRKDPRK